MVQVYNVEVTEDTPSADHGPTRRFFNSADRRAKKRTRTEYGVTQGIRVRDNRYLAYVTVNGKTYNRLFPRDTAIATMQAWREHVKATHATDRAPAYRRALPPSIAGWCYLYFVQQGNAVKVGRATDVRRRMEELQTASPAPLTLLVAVAAHASLEQEYIKRLEPFRLNGEWFIYGREIAGIVRRLQSGENPVELLFVWSQVLSPTDPTA